MKNKPEEVYIDTPMTEKSCHKLEGVQKTKIHLENLRLSFIICHRTGDVTCVRQRTAEWQILF